MKAYRAPWWLPGGHLQTIWPSFFAHPRLAHTPRYTRERWHTPDDDFVDVDLLGATPGAPWLVLFHGLESSSRSRYAVAFALAAQRRGWNFCVPHFRGCSGEPNLLPRSYHSGDFAEIGFMLGRIRERAAGPVYAAGVSLGGNALLRWAEEAGRDRKSRGPRRRRRLGSRRSRRLRSRPRQRHQAPHLCPHVPAHPQAARTGEVAAAPRPVRPRTHAHRDDAARLRRLRHRAPARLCGRRRLLVPRLRQAASQRYPRPHPRVQCPQRPVRARLVAARSARCRKRGDLVAAPRRWPCGLSGGRIFRAMCTPCRKPCARGFRRLPRVLPAPVLEVGCLGFGRRDVVDGFQEPPGIETIHSGVANSTQRHLHAGAWFCLYRGLSLAETLETIEADGPCIPCSGSGPKEIERTPRPRYSSGAYVCPGARTTIADLSQIPPASLRARPRFACHHSAHRRARPDQNRH